ncbi:AraC family transcriptional regulator [Rahnella contaminans]|jgi:AraC-like DNA-binding protein/quercetin dioxygenase-like cupin family protein|nr:helix-turn-helix transcriptional regulator [Rahnella contaminans]
MMSVSLSATSRSQPSATFDVDNVPRPVVLLNATVASQNWEYARHSHRRAQLFYTLRGILNCEIEQGVWIVPPQCAVWIPGNLPHVARGTEETECYCLFIEPGTAANLPQSCCTIAVSPLLRELMQKATQFPELYAEEGREGRLIATLIDEISAAPAEGLNLPMPKDARLKRLTTLLLANPSDKIRLREWATRIGMSERNMSRLLMQEIGMSFGRWRRQLHVILSLQRLSQGESVQTVALDLGYENASGFVTMFRKAVGKPPARYLAEHE